MAAKKPRPESNRAGLGCYDATSGGDATATQQGGTVAARGRRMGKHHARALQQAGVVHATPAGSGDRK